MPREWLAGLIVMMAGLVGCPWYFSILTVPVCVFSYFSWRRKDHKIYFITEKEYKPHYSRMFRQYVIKSILYMVIFAVGLILIIIKGV
jgi:hypothetical protein